MPLKTKPVKFAEIKIVWLQDKIDFTFNRLQALRKYTPASKHEYLIERCIRSLVNQLDYLTNYKLFKDKKLTESEYERAQMKLIEEAYSGYITG